jgi:hypothetical protein
MLAAIIVALGSAAPSIPAQAEWDAGAKPAITVSIAAPSRPVKIDDKVTLDVKIAIDQGPFRASPFLAASRGVSFQVTDTKGVVVRPLEPMPISPPAPPVQPGALVSIDPGKPLSIQVKEPAKYLFPGAGKFKVRATIRFMDASSTPPHYLSATSDGVIVEVGK